MISRPQMGIHRTSHSQISCSTLKCSLLPENKAAQAMMTQVAFINFPRLDSVLVRVFHCSPFINPLCGCWCRTSEEHMAMLGQLTSSRTLETFYLCCLSCCKSDSHQMRNSDTQEEQVCAQNEVAQIKVFPTAHFCFLFENCNSQKISPACL